MALVSNVRRGSRVEAEAVRQVGGSPAAILRSAEAGCIDGSRPQEALG